MMDVNKSVIVCLLIKCKFVLITLPKQDNERKKNLFFAITF